MYDLLWFWGFAMGIIVGAVLLFAVLEYENSIEAFFKRCKGVLFTKLTNVLNLLESFRKPNKNN